MRLIFSPPDYLNTNISDEQGNVLYSISTSGFWTRVTTITKYGRGGPGMTMGTIQWPRLFYKTLFWFEGKEIPVGDMFETRVWSRSLYFDGPNRQKYKWKISSHCWMKSVRSSVELVRFHKENLGILKPAHPAYLDVSPEVASMLDLIILTFVYAEWKRQHTKKYY